MRASWILVLCLAMCSWSATAVAASPDPTPIPADAICVVNGESVTKANFDRIIAQARKNYVTQGQPFPAAGSEEYVQLWDQATDYLVEQMIFKQEATRIGVVVLESDVEKRLQELIQSFFEGDISEYQKELDRQGLTEQDVRDNIRTQLLNERLFERVTRHVHVSERQARRYFRHHRRAFRIPRSRLVQHIMVRRERTAWRLLTRIRRGEDFGSLAKMYSQDFSSAPKGGKLTVLQGQTVPAFDRWAFRLRTGGITAPVRTQFGWHLIKALRRVQPGSNQTYRAVRSQIRQMLEQQNRSRQMIRWRVHARQRAQVACAPGYLWQVPDENGSVDGVTYGGPLLRSASVLKGWPIS